MDFFEASVLDVCVNLRGGNAGMAQHGLDRSEIGPMIQEVSGEGVPQHMGGDRLGNPGSNRTAL